MHAVPAGVLLALIVGLYLLLPDLLADLLLSRDPLLPQSNTLDRHRLLTTTGRSLPPEAFV